MSENYTGPPPFVAWVTEDVAGIFGAEIPARDLVLITNNTAGSVVFVSDTDVGSRAHPVRAGETFKAPFKAGELYAFINSTIEGEEVFGAEIEVRPVFVDSALARSVSEDLSGLVPAMATTIPEACGGDDLKIDAEIIRGTDLLGLNAPPVNIRAFDVSGRTLEARFTQPAGGTLVITPVLVPNQRIVRVEIQNADRPVTFAIVAVLDSDPTDVLGLFRGRVRGK
jgi:hypothetical protein